MQPGKIHHRLCVTCVVLYGGFLLGVWLLLKFAGDEWWFATFLLFGPRWVYGIPLLILAPWAVWRERRLLLVLALACCILIGPLMGLCLPWRRWVGTLRPDLRIMTCNVDGDKHDAQRFELLLRKTLPDVVLIQECHEEFAQQVPFLKGWQLERAGQLLIASRYPLKNKSVNLCQFPPDRWPGCDGLYCLVKTPAGDVGVCNVHPASPRFGLAELLDRRTFISLGRNETLKSVIENRTRESAALSAWAQALPDPKIIAGDFNMPTDSLIYRRHWAAYANAFSRAGCGFGYSVRATVSWFQYGLRIDHVLMTAELRPYRAFMGDDVGSDHLPVIADLDMRQAPPEPNEKAPPP